MLVIEIYPVGEFWGIAEVLDGKTIERSVCEEFTSKRSALKYGKECARLNNLLAVVLDENKVIQHGFDYTTAYRPASQLDWYIPAQ